MTRTTIAPLGLLLALLASTACNEGGGPNAPSNAVHGSRCFSDLDCMSGLVCSKDKGAILGECGSKAAGGGAPASTGAADPKAKATPAGGGKAGDDKPAPRSTASGKPTSPEPLPPPKPPKDAKPEDASPYSP